MFYYNFYVRRGDCSRAQCYYNIIIVVVISDERIPIIRLQGIVTCMLCNNFRPLAGY